MDGYGVCFLSDEFEIYVKKWWDQLAATDSRHPAMNMSDERFVWACVVISVTVKGNCQKKDYALSTNLLENSLYKHDTRITVSHISRWDFFLELLKPSIQRAILKEQPEIFKNQGDQISHVLAVMNPATM